MCEVASPINLMHEPATRGVNARLAGDGCIVNGKWHSQAHGMTVNLIANNGEGEDVATSLESSSSS